MKLIIITGPSGSGKTTLSKLLKKRLNNSHILSTDDYYKTGIISNLLSKIIESYYDKNISLNSKLLKRAILKILNNKKIDYIYKYDFKSKTKKMILKPSSSIENLIIEGIFALDLINFVSNFDYLLIKLKINKNICMNRIICRDQIERGKDKKESIKDFKNAWQIYKTKEKFNNTLDKKRELIFRKDQNIKTIIKKLIL